MNQTVTDLVLLEKDRKRINVSVSFEIDDALENASNLLGLTKSQIALMAIQIYLPVVLQQAQAVRELRGLSKFNSSVG